MNRLLLYLLVLSAVSATTLVCALSSSSSPSTTLSREGAQLVKDIQKGVGDLSAKCKDAFMAKITAAKNADVKLNRTCEDVKSSAASMQKACSQSNYDEGKEVVCDKVTKWRVALAKRKYDIVITVNKFSTACQATVKAATVTTWLDIDRVCDGANKTACRQHCSGNECDKLKDAACGAQALVAGILTLVLCLLGQTFHKL